MTPGYDRRLYLLPFDHRASFMGGILHEEGQATPIEIAKVKELKQIVFQGFTKAVAGGIPKDEAGILVDETYGAEILETAHASGYLTALPVEKSGQDEFTLEYGADFAAHIEKFQPTFVKVLIRYNPEGDRELNSRQGRLLQELTAYCQAHQHKFLLEALIPALPAQLAAVDGDKSRYDQETRPNLAVKMIQELYQAGVQPDIWKIEGFDQTEAYQAVMTEIRSDNREKIGLIILGRDGSPEQVKNWLNAGKSVTGIIGFAIGRTIFREPLEQFVAGQLAAEQAEAEISQRFTSYYQVFTKN